MTKRSNSERRQFKRQASFFHDSTETNSKRKQRDEGFLLSITLQLILFASGVDLKDSSVADVSKILPLIIVAQCYLLLKMV